MAMKLRCPFCRGAFPWEASKDWPKHCPLCDEEIGIPDRGDVIQMPSLRSARMKMNDQVFRDMEKGSEQRVQMASELTGASTAEMSSLKITNLKDNQRAGDIAAIESDAAMERIKQAAPKSTIGFAEGGQAFTEGIANGAVKIGDKIYTGIEPAAGARTIQRVQKKMAGLG